uniref:Transmembrane protein 182 n=1 Tax=Neogobius melanostomus TaxID=47308 RepID=A0A8C6U4A8_9GOBI
MKIGAAALFGGVLGVLGTLCFFLAFATDYWLVASDNCGPTEMPKTTQDENGTVVRQIQLYMHCFTNQPESKVCVHGYLFPLPVSLGPVPHPMYDSTAVFRGFWTVLMILALLCAPIGGFLLVCGIPFYSHKLYRVGGALLIAH